MIDIIIRSCFISIALIVTFLVVLTLSSCTPPQRKEWTPKNIYEAIERAENRNY